jgi:hypothetical protein
VNVALLGQAARADAYVGELARALGDAGHHAVVVSTPLAPRLARVSEAVLRRRGFPESLTSVPGSLAALRRGQIDVAHAFSPVDTLAALAWRRQARCPVVFTSVEPVDRASVADRRLRLWALERALGDSDAVVAASEQARAALDRWLAIDARVIDAGDADAYVRLYGALLDRRR